MNIFKDTRKLAILGVMLAITIILDVTPLGAIPLGFCSATITPVPAIITGIILGPVAGLIMGTSLGIVLLVHAATRPITILDPLFINPLVSVLPRIFVGVVAYYVFRLFYSLLRGNRSKVGSQVSIFIGAAFGSITNTALVMTMLYLVYAKEIVEKLGGTFKALLVAVITTNAIGELIVSGIIAVPIVVVFNKVIKLDKE